MRGASSLSRRASEPCRGPSPRLQGAAALIEKLAVTLDRCSVHAETAGGLGLGDALLDRFDDLLPEVPEVHRVRIHMPALPGAASSQPAVREWLEEAKPKSRKPEKSPKRRELRWEPSEAGRSRKALPERRCPKRSWRGVLHHSPAWCPASRLEKARSPGLQGGVSSRSAQDRPQIRR